MCALLALLFLVIPATEIYVILKVGAFLGGGLTFAVIALTAIVGAALAKSQGTAVLKQLQSSLAQGEGAAQTIMEGVMILVAGVTLLAPGFITDAVGLSLLLPPVRAVLVRYFVRNMRVAGVGSMQSGPRQTGYGQEQPKPPPPGVIDI